VLHCLDTDILLHSILLYSTSSDPVEVAKRKRAIAMLDRDDSALGCHDLYSEDMSHGRVVEGVRIVDPFR
jgi:predicted nucleic acid-binding protein